MITLLTGLEIAGNYPENILINSGKGKNGKYAGFMYMLKDWKDPLKKNAKTRKDIHKIMISTEPVFDSDEEVQKVFHGIAQKCKNKYFEWDASVALENLND